MPGTLQYDLSDPDRADILRALATQGIPGVVPALGDTTPPAGQNIQALLGGPTPVQPVTQAAPADGGSPVSPGGAPGGYQAPAPLQMDDAQQVTGPDPYGLRQSEADTETGLTNTAKASVNETVAKNAASRASADRQAAADTTTADQVAQENAQYFKDAQARNAANDLETAKWMDQVMQMAKSEPAPGRWWEHTSGFGKSLYLLGLAFGAAAQMRDPTGRTRNVVLDMVNQEIAQDMASQRDRITRELAGLKEKGAVMTAQQARDSALLQDEHAAKVVHLQALGKALALRAAAPGAEDDQAGVAAAQTWLEGQATKIAQDRHAAGQQMRQLAYTQGQENSRDAADNATKIAIANMEVGAKTAASQAAGQADLRQVSPNEVTVVHADGTKSTYQIPKGEGEKDATTTINAARDAKAAMANLRDQLRNTSRYGLIMNNENAFRAALAQLADPQVRAMAGRLNKDTADVVSEMYLGESVKSWLQRAKGSSPSEMADIVQQRMNDIDAKTARHFEGIAGAQLNRGDHVEVHLSDYRAPDEPGETPGGTLARSGVNVGTVPHPQTVDDVVKGYKMDAEEPGTGLPPLPPELNQVLSDHDTALTTGSRDSVRQAAADALSAIRNWEANQPGVNGSFAEDPNVKADADDARVRIQEMVNRGLQHASLADKIVDDQINKFEGTPGRTDIQTVDKLLGKNRLTFSVREKREMVDRINAALDAIQANPVATDTGPTLFH